MKLLRNILLSLLLLTSSIGFTQNNLIKVSTFNRFDLLFDGVDEYLNIDNTLTNVLATTTRGTWSLWVKPVNAVPSETESILTFADTDAVTELEIDYLTTSGRMRFIARKAGVVQWINTTDVAPFSDNTWTHIAITQDGINPIWYINSINVVQVISPDLDKTQWFNSFSGVDNGRIGSKNFNNIGELKWFNGNIDEVSFWNTDLTLTQIQEIYNNGKPTNLKGHSKVANLVAWYQMGEFSSFTGGTWNIVDGSTNSNTAVSVNMELGDRILSTLTYEQPLGLLKIGNNLIVSP